MALRGMYLACRPALVPAARISPRLRGCSRTSSALPSPKPRLESRPTGQNGRGHPACSAATDLCRVGRAAQDGRTLSDFNIGAHAAQANERRAALFSSLGTVLLSSVHLAPCSSLQFNWHRAPLCSHGPCSEQGGHPTRSRWPTALAAAVQHPRLPS